MLVLSRRVNQRIVTSAGVVVTVIEAGKDKVRLGIEAPDGVSIAREEIADRFGPEMSAVVEKNRSQRRKGSRTRADA